MKRNLIIALAVLLVALLAVYSCRGDELTRLNHQRSERGLYDLEVDPVLSDLARERLAANVARGDWRHNIRNGRFVGQFRPAKKEGCGNTYSPNRIYCCDMYTRECKYAGFAMTKVRGRYWQLLLLR